jgi:hypothetical protein
MATTRHFDSIQPARQAHGLRQAQRLRQARGPAWREPALDLAVVDKLAVATVMMVPPCRRAVLCQALFDEVGVNPQRLHQAQNRRDFVCPSAGSFRIEDGTNLAYGFYRF